jgi:very-short-patch-repair endonuclease/DNA polymerase III delta prime subunit
MQQLDPDQEILRSKIAQWKARLADTGKSNPLIKFRHDGPRSLEILVEKQGELDPLLLKNESLPFQMEDAEITASGSKITKKPGNQIVTRQSASERLKLLKTLRLKAKESIEERGVNSLFLAFGTLSWFDKDKTKEEDILQSPLILVPVELEKKSKQDIYHLKRSGEEIVLNPTLALKLKQTFGIDFPKEDTLEGKSCSELIEQIRNLVSEQKTWVVEDKIFLSLFSYAKASMVRDLIENEQRILDHPILQALSGDLTAYQSSRQEQIPASVLDNYVKPDRIFQVLDADSSQQVVIEAAKQGTSFVVQGPPGTGKSQTIVNMIAELVGSGKSVLLVAEKETALSVVYKRMDDCGLGHICLNLHHSSTKNKRKFVQDLSKSVFDVDQYLQNSSGSVHKKFFDEFVTSRQILNSYLDGLHTKENPLEKSAFELFGILLEFKRQNIPHTEVSLSNFRNWTPDNLSKADSLLCEIAKFKDYFYGLKSNIWKDSPLENYSLDFESQVDEEIENIRDAVDLARAINPKLSTILQALPVSNLESLEEVLNSLSYIAKAPMKLPDNWSGINVAEATSILNTLRENVQFLENNEPALQQRYSAELFSPNLPELSSRYSSYKMRFFDMLFNQQYRDDRSYLESIFKSQTKQSDDKFKADLTNAIKVQSIRYQLQQNDHPAKRTFGTLFDSDVSKQSDLFVLEQAVTWLKGIEKYSFADTVEQSIQSPGKRRELNQIIIEIGKSCDSFRRGFEFLGKHFDLCEIDVENLSYHQVKFDPLLNFLNIIEIDLADLQAWMEYQENVKSLARLGVKKKFLDAIRLMNLEAEQWFPVLERNVYQTCLNAILVAKPELKNFDIEVHERRIQAFSSLDFNQLEIAQDRLRSKHGENWQSWQTQSTAQSQLRQLKEENKKKRGHSTIRKMLNDSAKGIPELVKALKPCWMMSPLSVSQYIDPEIIHFDVLIFDEASQIRTEEVIPAIIRSDQVIVIGDRKQLPPTSFFTSGESDEDEEQDVESYESVLDECSTFMFERYLKWHYRSQDERLIAFSNLHFYDSQLVSFPNPMQNPELGVWFKHVPDGVYDRGGRRDNRREAEVVAEMALQHIKSSPNQSLGIIAFSKAQENAIQEQLEILYKKHPALEEFCRENSPQFFLKALENVQGDERDVILLSVGYGRDANGKLSLNFGPLNKRGGERRLNVAITRAKSKITLISSIRSGEIDRAGTSSEGVRIMCDYLSYAESGGSKLQGMSCQEGLHFDSPFEEDVYHALANHKALQNYIIRTQIGCSGYRIDLAVSHKDCPGEFILGIECDGASYHRSPTARDRDRLRQQILEKLGWKIHRIWSTKWFHSKSEQLEVLVANIEAMSKGQA